MKKTPEELYLDLIKKTLSFTLWPEPPFPTTFFNDSKFPLKGRADRLVSRILKSKQLQLVKKMDCSPDQREEGKIWPGYADTMIGHKRLDNLQFCVETVIRENVKGDLIETGVWRGGACILMRAVLAAHAIADRKVYVADSFEGLPKPEPDKYPADKDDAHHTWSSVLAISQEAVEHNFRKYGLLDDQVVFLKGWFKDTLPQAPIENLAVMRLDGDMYSSTMDALTNLYPKLSKGGFCIIDDYALHGCKAAVDDYRAKFGITSEMKKIDWTGTFWRNE